ncbi:hypothetical protein C8Q77DRAFT_789365 [Trametes polyzona]|nr:hypothetical protein C8Q77DRAFT_789365 [Trametes polyzona]
MHTCIGICSARIHEITPRGGKQLTLRLRSVCRCDLRLAGLRARGPLRYSRCTRFTGGETRSIDEVKQGPQVSVSANEAPLALAATPPPSVFTPSPLSLPNAHVVDQALPWRPALLQWITPRLSPLAAVYSTCSGPTARLPCFRLVYLGTTAKPLRTLITARRGTSASYTRLVADAPGSARPALALQVTCHSSGPLTLPHDRSFRQQ